MTPHSLRAVAIEDIQTLHNEHAEDLPFHIHIAEQQAEIEQCLAYCQQRPVNYLYDNLPVDGNWTLIHATHMQDECQRVIDSGAVAGICATTEANLGDGFFNTEAAVNPALNWAVGSDSHISVDPFEELRWYEYGLRLQNQQRSVLADEQGQSVGLKLWAEAAAGGNQSLCGDAGELALGKAADFIVLDSEHESLNALPEDYLLDSAIFSNRTSNPVRDLYLDGMQVVTQGRHPLEDESKQAYRKVLSRILSS